MAERLDHLDSLRGIAALCVAGFHAVMTFAMGSPLEKIPVFAHGYLMVDLFFVLSGFVIAYSSTHRLNDVGDAGRFQFRRLLRIYPLHLLTLCVFVLVDYVLRYQNIAAPNDAAAFAANLMLVHPFTETELTFNYPSWSIAAEFWTYLIFAVLTVLVPGTLRRWLGALIALAGLVALAFFKITQPDARSQHPAQYHRLLSRRIDLRGARSCPQDPWVCGTCARWRGVSLHLAQF